MDTFFTAVVLLFGLVTSGVGGAKVFREFAKRRKLDKIDPLSILLTEGEVTETHPIPHDRDARGQPVTVVFTDHGGRRRELHDRAGAGGYLLRPGSRVRVEYARHDPDQARIVEVAGPGTPFAVDGAPLRGTPALHLGFLIFGLLLFTAVLGPWLVPEWPLHGAADGLFALLPVVVGAAFLISGLSSLVMRHREGREQWPTAIGTITDRWDASSPGPHGRDVVPPRAFTVHLQAADGREVQRCPRGNRSRVRHHGRPPGDGPVFTGPADPV